MAKYSIKCSRCGAPIQWNNASLNVSCEYCGQPVNEFKKEDNLKNKFGALLKSIPLPSKESIRDKGKTLLSKQNILSESHLKSLVINVNRFFSKKKNILIFFGIPICFYSYIKINYPTKAKPFYPELPYKMPIPEATQSFWLLVGPRSQESLKAKQYWCPRWGENQYDTLLECINKPRKLKYYDKKSRLEFKDWLVFKMAERDQETQVYPTYEGLFDAAVNCKKGLIAFYRNGGIEEFEERNAKWPRSFGDDEKLEYERRKPATLARKMGKLWWVSSANNVRYDLEDGTYLSWYKNEIKESKDWLKTVSKKDYCGFREGFKHKCTNKWRLENINSAKSSLKRSKESYILNKLWAKENALKYSQLYRAACKNLKTKQYPEWR